MSNGFREQKILQTDTRLRTEDQMASQIGGEKYGAVGTDIKRRKRGARIYRAE